MKDKPREGVREDIGLGRNKCILQEAAECVTLSGALAATDKGAGRRGDVVEDPRIARRGRRTVDVSRQKSVLLE